MIPTWQQVALSNTYRTADSRGKFELRNLWMSNYAPQLYPEMTTNSAVFRQVRQSTYWQIPDKTPQEDEIIRPEMIHSDGYTQMELNPAFGKLNFSDQLKYRQIWFAKMANTDPEFLQLPPEQKQKYFENVIKRPPSSFGSPMVYDAAFDREAFSKEFKESADSTQKALSYWAQAGEGFVKGATSLVLGPVRALTDHLAGKENDLSAVIDRYEKNVSWTAMVSNANNPIPAFVGNIAGVISGPFPKLEGFLAGGFKGATAAGKLVTTPGILSKAGKLVGLKAPEAVYQIAGGVTAGALQGISQAMLEGKSWDTYLAQDIGLGLVFEPLSRYFSAIGHVRRAMKQAGYKGKISDFFKPSFKPMQGMDLDPEYARLLKADPRFNELLDGKKAIDANGFLVNNYTTKPMIDLRAKIKGLNVTYEGNTATIKRGQDVLYKTAGDDSLLTQRVSDLIDLQESKLDAKIQQSMDEAIAKSAYVEMRQGVFVPEAARVRISDTLKNNAITGAFDYSKDIRKDSTIVDRIYAILRRQGNKRAADSLLAMGINFASGAEPEMALKEHKAVVRSLKADIEKLSPNASYFTVDVNGNIIKSEEVPRVFLEEPYSKDPTVISQVAIATPEKIRSALSGIKKIYANEKRAITRLYKSRGIEVSKFADTRLTQLKVDLPGADGITHTAVLNFHTPQAAYKFMQGGMKNSVERLFQGNKGLQEGFEQWRKSLSKSDLKRMESDLLPYKFIAAQAAESEYYLSHYGGVYVLEDALDSSNRYRTFKTLKDAGEWVQENRRGDALNDMMGISPEVFEELYPNGANANPMKRSDPFTQLEEIKQASKKQWGVTNVITMMTSPTQYVMEMFERHPIGEALRKAGMGPVELHNVIRRAIELTNAWAKSRIDFLRKLSKGFNEKMSDYARRWWEALDDIKEKRLPGFSYETKAEVEELMTKELSADKVERIKNTSVEVHKMLEELFYMSKLDPIIYVKHYMSHIRSQMSRNSVKMSQHFDLRKVADQIPDMDKPAFFEFLREADPKAVAFETNIFRVANSYVQAMARRKFLAPVLKQVADTIKKTRPLAGASDADYIAFTHYMAEIFRSISGMHTPGELAMKLASQATLDNLAEKFKVPVKKNTVDIVQRLLTGATGSYLAFRPWSVAKQLTQSLITGAPVIGTKWWLEGINRTAEPGAIERLMRIGLIDPGTIPTGSGFALMKEGKIAGAIRTGMIPYQWGDWINRSIVYYGAQSRFRAAAKDFIDGKISKGAFLRRSGMHLYGAAQYNYALKLINSNDLETGLRAAEDHIARTAANRTQYLYDRFEQPQLFRNGIGRLAGQFASWPMNFLSFVSEHMRTQTLNPVDKARFLVGLSTISTATAASFASVGIRSEEFLPWNMVLFQGGPYYQMMNDGLAALNGDKMRWAKFVRAFTGLIPFSRAGETTLQALASFSKGDMWEGMLHLMSAPIYQDSANKLEMPLDEIEKGLIKAGNDFLKGKEELEKSILGQR